MSWTPRQTDVLKKQLADLGRLLGGKPANWNPQQPNKGEAKGTPRGGGRQKSDKSDGWPKACLLLGAGAQETQSRCQGHACVATKPPSCACDSSGAQESLRVQDQRAYLLGQARSLADKMDKQAKLAQEATRKRNQLGEELVTAYVRLERLPKEPLPVPKTPVATSSDLPGGPAPDSEALLAMLAFAETQAEGGNSEAH
eukprot:608824-Amphidinium_carterae.1